jgi:hypothetical protein
MVFNTLVPISNGMCGPSIKNNLVKIPPGLYGQPTEASVILEGIETGALLDHIVHI